MGRDGLAAPDFAKTIVGLAFDAHAVQRQANRAAKIDGEVKQIFTDQERVRENLAKLGSGPDASALRLRYVQQLEQQETRLESLRAEKGRVDTAQAEAEKRVDQLVKDLVIDRAL